MGRLQDLDERLWKRVAPPDENGCLLWTRAIPIMGGGTSCPVFRSTVARDVGTWTST